MKAKLFQNIFIAVMTVCILCFALTFGIIYSYMCNQMEEDLAEKTQYLAAALKSSDIRYLEQMEFNEDTQVTLYAREGGVLFQSREDFQRTEMTFSYETNLEDGTRLRLVCVGFSIGVLLLNMITPIVFILSAAIVLSLLLASRVAKSVTEPINAIDLETPDDRDVYDELKPLVRRINLQNRQIHLQMEELRAEHEKQDAMRREFTANVSHELKTPLTSISGYAEILRDGLVKEEDVRPFAGRIYTEAQRLITLVGDIMNLSRLDEGTPEYVREPVDLMEICRETIDSLRSEAERKQVQFSLSGESAEVTGVRRILEEIVYNLCDNAIKYNKNGGSVDVSVQRINKGTELYIKDTGIGISPEEQTRVFERFYRVNKSHSKEVGGTGLGLSIVKHGVLFHKAELKMDSTLGEGTGISILFPQE